MRAKVEWGSCFFLQLFYALAGHTLLSYRHSFHAGNFADVLKHVVLVEMLKHLAKKETPFEYIDTHAGNGLYDLHSDDALKLQEHATGIAQLNKNDLPELASYFEVLGSFNTTDTLTVYPGSPAFANYFLRPQDGAWLYELHQQHYEVLQQHMAGNNKIRVRCENGFDGLKAVLPPSGRRGLVLIDPSYEIKSDYDSVIKHVVTAHKKFSTGMYAMWYPVVDRQRINAMQDKLINCGVKNIQRFELGVAKDSPQRGMTSSGMFVINPPWTLFEKMAGVLPKLALQLSQDTQLHFKCDVLTPE